MLYHITLAQEIQLLGDCFSGWTGARDLLPMIRVLTTAHHADEYRCSCSSHSNLIYL